MSVKLHRSGFEHAKALVEEEKIVLDDQEVLHCQDDAHNLLKPGGQSSP